MTIKQLIFEKYKEGQAKKNASGVKQAFDSLMERENIQELIHFARADEADRNLQTLEMQNQNQLVSECVTDRADLAGFEHQFDKLEQMKQWQELGKLSEQIGARENFGTRENLAHLLKQLLSQEQ
mmetsp:Transcript_32920/g.50338  ORF Transcript_32920/g.50338 Transcript_32920/m.50338 type:complete len:125 (+) Transcript_32920:1026-1400(+)